MLMLHLGELSCTLDRYFNVIHKRWTQGYCDRLRGCIFLNKTKILYSTTLPQEATLLELVVRFKNNLKVALIICSFTTLITTVL